MHFVQQSTIRTYIKILSPLPTVIRLRYLRRISSFALEDNIEGNESKAINTFIVATTKWIV